ncbi:MAG: DUF2270 domain-containing protein [Anaerolineales bacterium]|nr:DUF2270 domain-containing protein [Anaerolineales bacterium]
MTKPVAGPPIDQRLDLGNVTRAEFINAMVHLYRGELGEATAWRGRIDTTSHWAIVLSASALSFVFGDPSGERHVLIPIISVFCVFLLLMEARRYRFFDIWRSRARLIEMNFYRPLLDGSRPPQPDWTGRLAQDLEWPTFHLPWWEAAGRRLRRNYQGIFLIQLGSWLVALMTFPAPTTMWTEIVARAGVGPVPGAWMMAATSVFYAGLVALGLFSFWASRIAKGLPAGHPDRLGRGRPDDV